MITAEIQDDPRQRRHALLPATLGESLSAAFDEGAVLGRPWDAITRRQEEERLQGRGGDYLGMLPIQSPRVDPGRMLAPQEATRRYQHLGLTFDSPVPEKLANLRAKKKQAEIRRQDILARGPTGVLPTGLQFGSMFVSALMDPLNIAASFVPVVGQQRYAAMVAKFGTTGGRASRGAIEGVVGNAMVEPFIFSQARREQLDYTMADALVNVAFGGLIGGGLHVAGGKIADIARARAEAGLAKADARKRIRSAVTEASDYLEAQTPEARVAALRTGVAQIIGDNRVNVEPVFDAEMVAAVRINDRMTVHAATENDTVMVVSLDDLAKKVEGVPDPAPTKRALPQEAIGMRVTLADGKLVGEASTMIANLRARGAKVAAISVDRTQAREIASVLKPEKPQGRQPEKTTPAGEQTLEQPATLDVSDPTQATPEVRTPGQPDVEPDGPYRQTRKRARPPKTEQKRIVEAEQDIDDTPTSPDMEEEILDIDRHRDQIEQEGLDEYLAQAEAEGLDVTAITKEVDEMEAEYNKAVDAAVRCSIGR